MLKFPRHQNSPSLLLLVMQLQAGFYGTVQTLKHLTYYRKLCSYIRRRKLVDPTLDLQS